MSETGIDIIDRLDAQRYGGKYYSELRREMLRIQNERDTVERERDDWWYKYQGCDVNRHELRAERDALVEARDAEFDIANGYWEKWQKVKLERNALLEALKDIDERAHMALGKDDQPSYGDLLTHMQGVRAATFAAIANTEGTE